MKRTHSSRGKTSDSRSLHGTRDFLTRALLVLVLLGLVAIGFSVYQDKKPAAPAELIKQKPSTLLAAIHQLPAALAAAAAAQPQADHATQLAAAYNTLNETHQLPPGTLETTLPPHAQQILEIPGSSHIDKAHAAFVLNNYHEAEQFARQAEAAAHKLAEQFATQKKNYAKTE